MTKYRDKYNVKTTYFKTDKTHKHYVVIIKSLSYRKLSWCYM